MNTILLLICSNIFMTLAWYGHLKLFPEKSIQFTILVSWGIAFFEYCFMIPANRIGFLQFDAFQLKVIQEVITLIIFGFFSSWVLDQRPGWNHLISFIFLLLAVVFAFQNVSPTEN